MTLERIFVVAVLALVAILTLGLLLALPFGAGADEPAHLQYAGVLALEGSVAPGRDVVQAQHPPLYHFLVGALYSKIRTCDLPDGPTDGSLPFYERRVPFSPSARVADPVHASVRRAANAPADPAATIALGVLPLLRATGLLGALLTAGLVLTAARGLDRATRRLHLLAAAACVLLPQFATLFATINNDQFAVLCGTIGFAILAKGVQSGRLDWRRVCWAGAAFGVGFLSKLLVLGAFAAGVILVLRAPGQRWSQRIENVLILGGFQIPAGLWLLRHFETTGSVHALDRALASNPELLRATAPDLLGHLEIVGQLFETFPAGIPGSPELAPGLLWKAVAVTVPLLALAGGLIAAGLGRNSQRTFGLALLGGVTVQLGALAYGNQHFHYTHGRYLYPLILPMVCGLTAGAPLLLGSRARSGLGLLALVAGVGGPWLLHGKVLPAFHPGHGIARVPGLVAYHDFGVPFCRESVVGEFASGKEPSEAYPRPGSRWILTDRPDHPIVIPSKGMDPRGLYLLSPRFHTILPPTDALAAPTVDLLADGALVSGPLTLSSCAAWPSFPLPRSAVLDGESQILVRLLSGPAGGLSELVVRRLPWTWLGSSVEPGAVAVRFGWDGDWPLHRALDLRLRLRAAGVPTGVTVVLPAQPGVSEVRLPLPDVGSGALELAAFLAEGPWCDVKLVSGVDPARKVVRRRTSPGLSVISLDPRDGRLEGSVVARLPAARFPPGSSFRATLLDETGRDRTAAFSLRVAGQELSRATDGSFVFDGIDEPPETPLEIVFSGGEIATLDRLVARTARPYVFDLQVVR